MNDVLIQTTGLSKTYGANKLFSGVALSLYAGKGIALMGHNGSGKTTLLKILAGLVNATAGTVARAANLSMGYVPEYFPKMNLTAQAYIAHMGRLEGLSDTAIAARSSQLFADFFLDDGLIATPMKHLSKGTLQKVGVVQALLGDHHALLLDEPLSGQDTASQLAFIRIIRERKQAGTAVLLSCHEAHLAAQLADTVYQIQDGALRAASLSEQSFAAHDTLVFDYDETIQSLPEALHRHPVALEPGMVRISLPETASGEVIVMMIQSGFRLREIIHENNA